MNYYPSVKYKYHNTLMNYSRKCIFFIYILLFRLEYNDIYSQISKFQKNILDISLDIQNYLYKAERDNYNGIEIAEVEMKIQEVENKILDLKQLSIDYISKILKPEIKLKMYILLLLYYIFIEMN